MIFSWSDQGNLRQLVFDATITDTHLVAATATEHPVENGSAITDNVRPMPLRLSVEVVISNLPLDLPSVNEDNFTSGARRQQGSVDLELPSREVMTRGLQGPNDPATFETQSQDGKATLWQWSARFERVRTVYEALSNVALSGTPITVQTTLVLYDEMVIASMSTPRSVEMGSSAIRFTIDLQQIRTVESQTVAPIAAKKRVKQAGHKPTKEEKDPKKSASLAKHIQDWFTH